MGKSKRNKNGHRADPMNSIKAVKPPTDPELLALREKSILPVIKDLRSADPKARSSAASAVANIAQTEKCRKLLLREQIVPIVLAETLTDASLDSRAAGWEILRVIVAEEESDFCVHLFRLDILTAMEHAVKNVSAPTICCSLIRVSLTVVIGGTIDLRCSVHKNTQGTARGHMEHYHSTTLPPHRARHCPGRNHERHRVQ